jgi:hypothetical protein
LVMHAWDNFIDCVCLFRLGKFWTLALKEISKVHSLIFISSLFAFEKCTRSVVSSTLKANTSSLKKYMFLIVKCSWSTCRSLVFCLL